jgi:hypothetical protein
MREKKKRAKPIRINFKNGIQTVSHPAPLNRIA